MLAKNWQDKDIRRGGVLVDAGAYESPHMDPLLTEAAGMGHLVQPVYNRLVRLETGDGVDPFNQSIIGDLADKWDISSDGKVYTFHIRRNVKWHNLPPLNGRTLTTDDVVYALELWRTRALDITAYLQPIVDKIEAVDSENVRVSLKQPSPFLLQILASPFGSYIMPKEVDLRDGGFKLALIGTGPMVLDFADRTVGYNYKRNPDYFKPGQPYLDGLKTLIITDATTRTAAFRTGQTDMGASTPSAKSVEDLLRHLPDAQAVQAPGLHRVFAFGWRMDKAPFSDVRVRRALTLAIDWNAYVDTLYPGQEPDWSITLPWLGILDKPMTLKDRGPWYQYNPTLAKQLLTEAGYPNGFDGGEIYSSNAFPADWHLFFIDAWKKLGVTAKLKVVPHSTFIVEHRLGNYDTMSFINMHSDFYDFSAVVQLLHSKNPANFTYTRDPALDKLIEQERVEMNLTKRRAIDRQIWDRVLDQAFMIYHAGAVSPGTVYRGYVHNISIANPLYNGGIAYVGTMLEHVWMDDRAPKRSLR